MRAIILAAGVGSRLTPHTDSTQKCLLEVGGKPLLRRHLEVLAALGIPEKILYDNLKTAIIGRKLDEEGLRKGFLDCAA